MELVNKISQKSDMVWLTILKTSALLRNVQQPSQLVPR